MRRATATAGGAEEQKDSSVAFAVCSIVKDARGKGVQAMAEAVELQSIPAMHALKMLEGQASGIRPNRKH